jgi:LmbE family N-acetylglucosaminyl deacetylase
MSRRRILLLVPHPDDEIVGCAVAARRAIAAGAEVFAIYLTTGVPPRAALFPWQRAGHAARVARRHAEAERAAVLLGIRPVAFLDWPSRTLKAHIETAMAAIRSAIGRHAIDLLWVPAWEGAHQDHDVANFLAARLAALCPAIEFAEYHFHGGRAQSGAFFDADGSERVITLTPDEAAWKRRALATYASERGNLAHIACATEALRPLPRHDYASRPHFGKLFYERFQWVPFRHPRIDFDTPETICAALSAHAAACAAQTRPVRDGQCAPDPPG